jgi:hypothetical protein
MELKQSHTERVCAELTGIGKAIGMNERELAFAEVIGWLHDIGRFEQFNRFRTFADDESENHAETALRVIDREGLLEGFIPEMKKVVLQSILNHNRAKVPENEPCPIDFYSRLLRDADKLDVWQISINMNIFHKIKTETFPEVYDVPAHFIECFEQNQIITLDQVQSFYDSILFRVSWIFDLNFSFSLLTAHQRNIPGNLIKKIPVSEETRKIQQLIDQYIRKNI